MSRGIKIFFAFLVKLILEYVLRYTRKILCGCEKYYKKRKEAENREELNKKISELTDNVNRGKNESN